MKASTKHKNILILGGARSGKSDYAQKLALKLPQPVLFVATAEAGDEEMKQRIEEHRKNRPATWKTLEATARLSDQVRREIGPIPTVIVDCVTLLVSNIFSKYLERENEPDFPELVEKDITTEIDSLVDCMSQVEAGFIVVTNEVGQGLVPVGNMSRLYRDLLGRANCILAQNADDVYLMVAGLPVKIK
jgi:adenosylcobinamide kinase/adenosylcobinamide-phosphate guanylyltransferase